MGILGPALRDLSSDSILSPRLSHHVRSGSTTLPLSVYFVPLLRSLRSSSLARRGRSGLAFHAPESHPLRLRATLWSGPRPSLVFPAVSRGRGPSPFLPTVHLGGAARLFLAPIRTRPRSGGGERSRLCPTLSLCYGRSGFRIQLIPCSASPVPPPPPFSPLLFNRLGHEGRGRGVWGVRPYYCMRRVGDGIPDLERGSAQPASGEGTRAWELSLSLPDGRLSSAGLGPTTGSQ